MDDAERIKYAIDAEYRDHNIRYVMLVSDGNVLPVRYNFGELGDYSPERTIPFLLLKTSGSQLIFIILT